MTPGGRGEFEGIELGGQPGGVGDRVREEVGGGLDEDGVPRVEIGAEGGIERGEGAEFITEMLAEAAELRGERAGLRGPVIAEGGGVRREGARGEEARRPRECRRACREGRGGDLFIAWVLRCAMK